VRQRFTIPVSSRSCGRKRETTASIRRPLPHTEGSLHLSAMMLILMFMRTSFLVVGLGLLLASCTDNVAAGSSNDGVAPDSGGTTMAHREGGSSGGVGGEDGSPPAGKDAAAGGVGPTGANTPGLSEAGVSSPAPSADPSDGGRVDGVADAAPTGTGPNEPTGMGNRDADAPPVDDEEALVVPQSVTILPLQGGNGVLEVTALTLRQGAESPDIYVAMKNTGDQHACSAAVSLELYDWDEQSVASGISGLLTRHFYRVLDGSDLIAACIGPGDVSVAAITDLPVDLAIEDVGYIVYRSPYFALEVEGPIDGFSVTNLEGVPDGDGTVYAGEVVNGFDVTVADPEVFVFPLTRVGRPLGVAKSSATLEIPPGGTWAFETELTNVVAAPDALALVAGALLE